MLLKLISSTQAAQKSSSQGPKVGLGIFLQKSSGLQGESSLQQTPFPDPKISLFSTTELNKVKNLV